MPPATVRALGQPRLAGLHRQPRLAGLHRQPRRDALARAGHRARPPRQQSGPAGARPLAVRPWTLTALAARSALVLIRAFARIARARDNACVCAGHRRCLAEHIPGACYAELATTGCVPWACAAGIAGEAGEFLTGTRHVPASHRPLAAVLFTDIVGSTQQAALLGDRAWKGRLDQHDEIAERQIRRFAGRFVKSTGDGTLATFDGPARAIHCALAVRDALHQLGLDVRAGVHAGEIELRGDDVAGIAVHIAQRVSSVAGPGDVLVSRTIVDLVAGSDLAFEDRGEHALKGVPGDWRLFAATDRQTADVLESAVAAATMRKPPPQRSTAYLAEVADTGWPVRPPEWCTDRPC